MIDQNALYNEILAAYADTDQPPSARFMSKQSQSASARIFAKRLAQKIAQLQAQKSRTFTSASAQKFE